MELSETIENRVIAYIKDKCREKGVPFDNERPSRLMLKNGEAFYPDLILQNGCSDEELEIKKNTIVEIKRRLYSNSLKRLIEIAKNLPEPYEHFCVLYIDSYELSEDFLHEQELPSNFLIRQIPLEDLPDVASVESALDPLEDAKIKFATGPITLFLGAGVSQSVGAPGWDNLLKGLKSEADSCCPEIKNMSLSTLRRDSGQSHIVIGRFLKQAFVDNKKYQEAIQKLIYCKPIIIGSSRLVDTICRWAQNNFIQGIITYNYDDIIEQSLESLNIVHHSVFRINEPGVGIPICHVHGMLPQHNVANLGNAVLSEDDYHSIYNEYCDWSTVEQLHALNRTHCFFIGLSMQDPNLRRLLDASQGKKSILGISDIRHFAFLCEEGIGKRFMSKSKKEKYKRYYEKILESLGVRIVWYKKHDDLPDILERIEKERQ